MGTISSTGDDVERPSKGTGRIEDLSDGIFGFAMTLLVLDIHVPVADADSSLLGALLADWPTYLAFAIGFFTLLVCWINHHYMFELIRRSDGVLLLLNGFKLLVVTFTPFATALLSKYIGTPAQRTAVNVYTFSFFLMGLSMSGLWYYAQSRGLANGPSRRIITLTTRLYLLAAILPAAMFLLSFVTIYGCLLLSGVMFAIFLFPKAVVMRLAGAGQET